jgi:hypothetical protein
MKFDLIVGNPPFQKPRIIEGDGSSGNVIWDQFVFEAFKKCKRNGYVSLIIPASWRKPCLPVSLYYTLHSLMKEKQIDYIKMYDREQSRDIFNATIRFDLLVIKNCYNTKPTLIIDTFNQQYELDISNLPVIPNYDIINLLKLFSLKPNQYEVLQSSLYSSVCDHVSETQDDIYRYPLVHALNKTGPRFLWSSRNDRGLFGVSKVIICESGLNDVLIDMEGRYGLPQHSFAIKVETLEEAQALREGILLLNNFINALKWSLFRIDYVMFKYLKKEFWLELRTIS